jgi:hypothetical protein
LGKLVLAPAIAAVWNFVGAIRAGSGVMAAFNVVVSANPIGALIVGVVALAGAAYLIYRNWGSIAPWFAQLFASLNKIVGGFVDFLAGVFTLDFGRAWDGLKSIFQAWVDWFSTLFGGVIGTINAFGSGVKRVASFLGISSGGSETSPATPPSSPPGPFPPAPSQSAATAPGARAANVGGEVHIRIDSEGRPGVVSAQASNPRVPLVVDAGRVM